MTEAEVYKLIATIGAYFPHQAPGESTAHAWARSRRLRAATLEQAVQAVELLAERRTWLSLADLCQELDRRARRLRDDRALEATSTRVVDGERQRASASVVSDIIEGRLQLDSAAQFNAEVERRLGGKDG